MATKLAGRPAFTEGMKAMLAGKRPSEVAADLGLDYGELRAMAREAAEEEFATLEMPSGRTVPGRLSRVELSPEQRREVRQALTDTFVIAAMMAAWVAKWGHGDG